MDGANVYTTVKSLGFEIDYKRLLNEFRARRSLLRSFYYTAVFEDSERPSLQPLLDWLAYNGFTVVTKAGKESEEWTAEDQNQRGAASNKSRASCAQVRMRKLRARTSKIPYRKLSVAAS